MPYFILTTHQKGGVGKSTLTYNLAINLKDKAKVCIVDMDVQGSLSDFKNFSPVPVLPPDKLPELKNSDIDLVPGFRQGDQRQGADVWAHRAHAVHSGLAAKRGAAPPRPCGAE